MKLSPRMRWGIKIALALLAVVVVVGFALWQFPQQVLTVDSGSVKADVIVVLGGGSWEARPARAAELFQDGAAPTIICTGEGDCSSNKARLVGLGVPAPKITTECESLTTSENARFTIPLLRKLGAHRVILVTSWYHSRRALNCFEHYAPDLTFYSRPSYFGADRAEWKAKHLADRIYLEYLKNLGYLIRYGVWPF